MKKLKIASQLFFMCRMETLIQKSIDELKELLQTKDKDLVLSAIFWKEKELASLSDEELEVMIRKMRQSHRYMRKCEDVVLTSSKENIRGFYEEWDFIDTALEALWFETERRTTLS